MKLKTGLLLSLALILNTTYACNFETGEREQVVQISIDGSASEGFLTLDELSKKKFKLSDGANITVSITPATDEEYQQVLSKLNAWKYTAELVNLSVSGVTGSGAKIAMSSFAGANSLQTLQSIGDSKQKVEILLLKQVCVGPSKEKNN
ncbi:hypothetical protein [Paraferrimonas haliotis]|uniref:Uncharacterized protein n=1 Tax=Paraferrimonas haliotis TaxID=2013866 RepID=A0AA37WW89_9GAMM|nr:hypothetical protein [Paraferrimonas haliotis]GLS83132.1 hypothetical protein GCM10007894_11090 [Paraferrimonas haliotis]